jgi:predicted ATPase
LRVESAGLREEHPMRFSGSETYVATRDLTLAVNAAITLQRPLLIKGEPGTGKTMLAEEVAAALGLPLFSGTSSRRPRRSRVSTNTTPSRACATRSSARRRSPTSAVTSSRASSGRPSNVKRRRWC